MTHDTVQITFKGFQPSDAESAYLESLVHDLHMEAPYASLLKASFVKAGDKIKGVVKITSRAGEFFAEAYEHDTRDVGRKLLTRLRRQLLRWKGTRFNRVSQLTA